MDFKRQAAHSTEDIELHGFCDASERAYGACIYLRTTDQDGKIQVQLYCAKSRITPLKGTHTIPRLELCAAELLSQLYTTVKRATNIKSDHEVFWSDSTVVLHWIKTPPHQLQRFVANRVTKIQERTNSHNWRHIRTKDNPADAVSRGQLPSEFLSNHLWRHGPQWLTEPEGEWPQSIAIKPREIPELKKAHCFQASSIDTSFLRRYSSFKKLIRITAFCLRWKTPSHSKTLTVGELEKAEHQILRVSQNQNFAAEFKSLKKGQSIHNTSRLKNSNPFLGEDGIIHVGERLQKAVGLDYYGRHPIVLPKGDHITDLIIRETHESNLHVGIQTTLHLVREKYWPIDGLRQVERVIRTCIKCIKAKPTAVNYPMANLPRERINEALPFTHTGVDYCGPFFIKEKKHRNRNKVKVWICIFVCFTTKAVHIEVVSDMTSEEFLATLSRFIARHPTCRKLHSDNATTFTGSNNELKELQALIESKETKTSIQTELIEKGIEWDFIPPQSPHCGGLWEAAVKSTKHHLKRVISTELLTYEQLNALYIKIEAILNSRPLTPLSEDPNDLGALTPSHFLHGIPGRELPTPDWTQTPSNRLSQWQRIEQMKQMFWNRWHKEYLNHLTTRSKWTKGEHPITIGSLVLIRDDNLPSLKWKMGRVLEIYPAADGIIRRVKLKTSTGSLERNVKRLVPLPVTPTDQKTN